MRILTVIITFLFFYSCGDDTQKTSFIVLGDIHYDQMEDHQLDWLMNKPDDLRQVKEYTTYTEENWDDFMLTLHKRIRQTSPEVKAILQLGDLSEGLAGSGRKAMQMALNTIRALDSAHMPVPWILTKGNHDITGPGAKEAFDAYYLPFIREETGNDTISSANYSYHFNNIQIVCIDSYDSDTDLLSFLREELSGSDAKYKFVAVHEPVIPVTERCWHLYRRSPEKRAELLEIIASNRAVLLCGHLHRYSVVSRNTPYGNIVQVMSISVVRDRGYIEPDHLITTYGPSLVDNKPDWQPETAEKRREMLENEAEYVHYFKQTDLPGYAIISVDDRNEEIMLSYYAAFGKEPYDVIDLSTLF